MQKGTNIPPIFLISLQRRTDRRNRIIPLLDSLGLQYEIFDAIETEPVNTSLKKGEYSCFLSHQAVCRIAEERKLDNYIVFEDDIDFLEGFVDKLPQYLNLLPNNYNLVYFSGNHQARVQIYKQDLSNNIALGTCSRIYSTAAFMVHSNVYKEIQNLPYLQPIDVMLGQIQQRGYTFTAIPSLCWQEDCYSDIEQGFTTNRKRDTSIQI